MKIYLSIIFIFALYMAVSCASNPTIKSETAKETAVALAELPVEVSWENKWNKMVTGAKKEGNLFLAVSLGREEVLELQRAFSKRFQINADILSGKGSQMTARIMAERQAGLFLWDIYMGGANSIVTYLKRGGATSRFEEYLVLPDVIDKKLWFEEKFHWVDEPENTILNFGGGPTLSLLINKEMVKGGEISSYTDLLNSKWKDRILIHDPSVTGKGLNWFAVVGSQIMGMDYMRKLAQQNPTLTRDQLLLAEWVARGKFPISIAAGENEVLRFQEVGAPIDYIEPKEGTFLATDGANLVLMSRPAHPEAAKVFVNWILSKEGQTIYNKINVSVESYRKDIPKNHLDPRGLRQPGVKYISSDKTLPQTEEFAKMAREIFQIP